MQVILTIDIDEIWGVEDLLFDFRGYPRAMQEDALKGLFSEDIGALIEAAKWSFVLPEDEERYIQLEKEHLGDPEKKTGIYSPESSGKD